MWELDYKESWVLKNWCFWTVVLEKILESPLDCKEIQPVHRKGDQSWVFIGRTEAEAETPILWPPDVKNWLVGKDHDAGKDWRQEEEGWDSWTASPTRWTCVWASSGSWWQGSLACCSPWGRKELDTTEQLNWAELITYYGAFCNAGGLGLIPGSERSPGGGHDNPLQYSCLENPMDREAWRATVHGVTKSWTPLKWLSMHKYVNFLGVRRRKVNTICITN